MPVSRNVNGLRECLDCKEWLVFDRFATTIEHGVRRMRPRCKPCHYQHRAALRAKSEAAKRRHPCRVCGTALVYRPDGRCRPCADKALRAMAQERQPRPASAPKQTISQVAKHDADELRSKAAMRRDGDPDRYMEVAYGEIWTLTAHCSRCGKWILVTGACYSCATGRTRCYVRAEERRELGVAV